ncbi:MAG TPA: ATP-binding cassette domain-containing protein [bacterium]|nr:ATP-binding cassette domain-containing protein [bacterium]
MIACSNLTLRFGKKILFEDVTLKFKPGYIYGIVGANGAGKSTFLKILTQEIKPTTGTVSLDSGVKMGWLRQDHYAFDDLSVLDTVLMGKRELYDVLKEKDALYAKPEMTEKDGERAAELEIRFGEMDGYSAEATAGELLEGLGLPSDQHGLFMKQLTGGWKLRVLLAQILFAKPDLLLLDEPTNHLDIASINWLEQYLVEHDGTIILVSHDRHFLNNICTHMVDIDRQKITIYTGNYDFFVQAAAGAMDAKQTENKRREQRAAELKTFIARFSANASKSKQATSRFKMLDNLASEMEEIVPSSRQYPRILLKPKKEPGKDLVEVESLSKAFNGKTVLKGISLALSGNEKLAVIGPNGVGKTTFLRCLLGAYTGLDLGDLAGRGIQADSGKVSWGKSVFLNYMPQDTKEELVEDLDMVTWLKAWGPNDEIQTIRGYLGRMLFSGEQQEKSVKVLSGGECQRIFLARMMLLAGNTLILDEPSNHMDLESIEALSKTLEEFPGSVLFTSHDQDLISKVATRILELRPDGSWWDFKGPYAEYQQALEQEKRNKKKAKV